MSKRNKKLSRCISTRWIRENTIETCLKTLQDNFKSFQIRGPTADEIAKDLRIDNKVCLITGANSGIGLEVTRCLSTHDCNVLMACRNTYEASVAAKNVCKNFDRLKFYEINLASLDSVKNCSKSLLQSHKSIDIVILNAATFGLPWTLTENGLEMTFQVNFLSQYYLLLSLEKIFSPNARIIFTSSDSHKNVMLSTDVTVFPSIEHFSLPEEKYTSIRAYNLSKLCGVLAMRYLNYRWMNTEKSVFCAHPGTFVKTGLCRNWWMFEILYLCMLPFSKTISQAASTVVYCAASPDLLGRSGLYIKDCKQCEESELGKNTHLSFRIHDLVIDILRENNVDCDKFDIITDSKPDQREQHLYEEPIISSS